MLTLALLILGNVSLDPYQQTPTGFMSPFLDVFAVGYEGDFDFESRTATDASDLDENSITGFGGIVGVRMFEQVALGLGYEYQTSDELKVHIGMIEARWLFPLAPGIEFYTRLAGLVSRVDPKEDVHGSFDTGFGVDAGLGFALNTGVGLAFFADAGFRYLAYEFDESDSVTASDPRLGGGGFVARAGIELR